MSRARKRAPHYIVCVAYAPITANNCVFVVVCTRGRAGTRHTWKIRAFIGAFSR